MAVDDVDLAIPEDAAQPGPDARIERVTFLDFHVVHRQGAARWVDANLVSRVAEVADGDVESRAVGARGAEENRLLGPPPVPRTLRSSRTAMRGIMRALPARRRACVTRAVSASARPSS